MTPYTDILEFYEFTDGAVSEKLQSNHKAALSQSKFQFYQLEFDEQRICNKGGFTMAGATIRMVKKQYSLQEIHEKIHYIEGSEQVSKIAQIINDVIIWTLVYEKYYFRTGSYTSMTIVLTEHEQEQIACVVSSGGGADIVNQSLGANRKFAKECVKVLESCGFSVIESDLDAKDKGLVEHFLK